MIKRVSHVHSGHYGVATPTTTATTHAASKDIEGMEWAVVVVVVVVAIGMSQSWKAPTAMQYS